MKPDELLKLIDEAKQLHAQCEKLKSSISDTLIQISDLETQWNQAVQTIKKECCSY